MTLFTDEAGRESPFSFHILEELPNRDIIDDHLTRKGWKKFTGKVTMFGVDIYTDNAVIAGNAVEAAERLKTIFAHQLKSALGPEIRLR